MSIETWFPLALYLEDLWESADHQQSLLDAVLALEQQSGERRAYPEMAWTGDLHRISQIHTDPRFGWICAQVEAHTQIYLQELGVDLGQVDLYFQRSWPIVSRKGQAVGIHRHPTAHISAVYYIAVPDGQSEDPGSLVFFDDARVNEICPGLGSENTQVIAEWTDLNLLQVVYPPVAGRLVIFPAKQRHEVTINTSDQIRVSLSFDIAVTAQVGQNTESYEFLPPPPDQWQRFGSRP